MGSSVGFEMLGKEDLVRIYINGYDVHGWLPWIQRRSFVEEHVSEVLINWSGFGM